MLRSTPEYIKVHQANIAAQAPSREVRELLALRRAERREKLAGLVEAIRRSIPRMLPIGSVKRVELEATTLATADARAGEEIR